MWHRASRRWKYCILASFTFAFTLSGCGGSDGKKGPVNPGPGGNATFNQSEAIAQSQTAGAQAIALVQSMASLAAGVSKRADGTYQWNAEEERWEWHYVTEQAGYNYDWMYTVQYLDSQGQPQEAAAGASTINHAMSGTGTYHSESQGALLDYDYTYTYNVGIAGLGSQVLAMTGTGGWDIDYSYVTGGQTYSSRYAVGWHTLGNGITAPVGGGCPTGSIRYDFAPYYMVLVFDGSANAVATLYNSGGVSVAAGARNYVLNCGAN